ncbi:hypothetical protein [Streptomyces sp. TP-A0356]|nr:hypothetical protein [Streptomyces sp. TP-A0356]
MLAAAEGDIDAARRAWVVAGLPESGSVSITQLVAALAEVPNAGAR